MIAKILTKSATFNAIIYNDEKVREGVAELLEMTNMGLVEQMSHRTTEATRKYFMEYSQQNGNIKYPQFHVTISCKGEEYDKKDLLDIAHLYLLQMGYDYTKQPTMIYFHHDTGNNHLHVITSRIDKEGNKIDDSFEKCRSNKIINEIMDVDYNEEAKRDVDKALKYSYESIGQFQAIMESLGYESFEKDDMLHIKKGGGVLFAVPTEKVAANVRKSDEKKKRGRQIKALLMKYQALSSSKDDLQKYMKDLFGASIVFLGRKDAPYGYFLVDHKFSTVYKGSDIMKIKDLMQFKSFDSKEKEITAAIRNSLEANPRITTKTMNGIIKKMGGFLTKGKLTINRKAVEIDGEVIAALKSNDKINYVNGFNPVTEKERDALVLIFKVAPSDLSLHAERRVGERMREAVAAFVATQDRCGEGMAELREELNEQNVILVKSDDDHIVIDLHRKCMFSLNENGIKIREDLMRPKDRETAAKDALRNSQKGARKGGTSTGRAGKVNLNEGKASDSINENPDDNRRTDWSRMEGEGGMKR